MDQTCSLEESNKEKKLIEKAETEIENYIKLIFDILNKNINSTIDQRNDIYKFIQTTDFSDNSYFLNIKNNILEIINNDNNLLEEYNNINGNQSGGVKKFISAAFLAFAALSNALTYHADQSDYATSVAKLNPETSLVTIGNQIREGSCAFGSSAIIHGDNFKSIDSIKDILIKENTFGISIYNYNKILADNGLPGVTMLTVAQGKKETAKNNLRNYLDIYGQKIKKKGLDNGEFRTMMTSYTYNYKKDRVMYGHARAVIWDTEGNLAVYDPNIGFIYSTEYGSANPEIIEAYKLIGNKFQIIETPSIASWLVDNQAAFGLASMTETDKLLSYNNNKYYFYIDFPDSIRSNLSRTRDVVSVDSLNNMEKMISNVYQKQIDIAPFFSWGKWGASSKVKKWISTHQTPKIGGQASVADTPIDFVINCDKRINKNPHPFGSNEYEIYNSKVIYSELYPETLEEVEKTLVSEPLDSSNSFSLLAEQDKTQQKNNTRKGGKKTLKKRKKLEVKDNIKYNDIYLLV